MGCASGKHSNANEKPNEDDDEPSFDPKLLQDSWNRLRGGKKKKENKAADRTLTRGHARHHGRDVEDNNSNWDKLIPMLVEGFGRGSNPDCVESDEETVSFLGVTTRKRKKKTTRKKKKNEDHHPMISKKEALAGISALDLLVRAADDADRLDAVLEHLGRSVGDWSREPEVAARLIEENLQAVKNAVVFLLDRQLKRRGTKKEALRRTWLNFIDHCCQRILSIHARTCQGRPTSLSGFDAFSSAAKKFLKDNLWVLLTVGYQLGTLLWKYSHRDPAIEADGGIHDPILGPNARADETMRKNQGLETNRMRSGTPNPTRVCVELMRRETNAGGFTHPSPRSFP